MASIVETLSDGGGKTHIEYYASAAYVRNGSKVTITVTCSIYGWGYTCWAYLAGTEIARNPDPATTVKKTFNYDNADAKTYSFTMGAKLSTAKDYPSYDYTATLTIDVPAYVPPGAQAWVNPDGTWRKAEGSLNVDGVWKTLLAKINIQEGEWEP